MNFIKNVKSGVSAAVETISDAAQNLIEKNRTNAKINRLKLVIKNESAILNKAYIQLGKYYFENSDEPKKEDVESLFEIISNSKARLKMSQDLYSSTIQKQTEEAAESEETSEPFEDTITVACSNEEDYDGTSETAAEKAEEAAEEIAEEVEEVAEEIIEEVEEAAEEIIDELEEVAEEIAEEAADDDKDAF